MEDRKRPGGTDDSAPPAKRQAVTVNGTKSHQDADLPWKDDIESYQKDAILRQMREYKREKNTVEAELREIEKRSKHHDDHLRTIDIWFDQMLDEIKVLSGEKLPAPAQDGPARSIPPGLFFEEQENLSKHLGTRKDKIVSALSGLFARYPPSSPETAALQQQLSKLLAAQKEHICELQRVNAEKEQLSDRLDTATHRYMIAEKKIDRIKSAQVQKLEKAAIASTAAKEEPSSSTKEVAEAVNGLVSGTINEEVETARDQALAEAAKRKEQLDQLEADNKKLTEEVTALKVKLTGLSDDDYAKTDLFKVLKSQHEDVIKRINNLEATNIQLREEAQKYQAERTAYRIKVDDEARATIGESEGNVARAEADLARIRNSRDELLAKVSILEASNTNNDASREQTKEMVSACESRIAALESECNRFRLQASDSESMEGQSTTALDSMSPEELRHKITTLESQYKLLSNELPAMETAWKKAQAVASKKISELSTWEENISRANADKAKADQKFFAAMKAKEMLEQQIRVLRLQATKSTEIVAQLKDADMSSRSLVDKLEKQSAEMRSQMEELSIQHRLLQQKVNEGGILSDGQNTQISELKKLLETKDANFIAAKHAQREADAEKEKMQAQVQGLEKQCEHWKQKSLGNQSDEASMMQTMLQCQICKNNFKDTALKTCGHIFCNGCVQDRLINRARKCPNCGKAFGANDTMRVHL
ncbi:E3 ubiquitin-protein ligase bre1 [Aaosphaeria arxii CBS 175.79]|uniref:E3 ubiquitin protein ligase n=1 Tax=Aaosphaeria arxii CBS 175.79 TaxID=1450172 RepID=A0A6A5XHD3_9PLEO|nr:E3 ubiquitin-protein ligase bre1 [Aaosphaeria arxii CBS 175.79]KAF2012675.1 E3 ubiquitin-protein ligase bre1 [Aaosphaeria arxii CBS 175.79]